ncbi:MAG: carboxypeptidase regulatory-like domain-containing protein, partial [Vicinamibacterales bacterium]
MHMQIILFTLLMNLGLAGQTGDRFTGTVVDSSGAPIADATVRLEASGTTVGELRTADDGRFAFTVAPSGTLRVVVTASGFAVATEIVSDGSRSVQVTLQPAPFYEAVNVTSSRTDVPRADPTVTMTVLSSSELLTSAPVTLDDALKLVPGFTLFRRTSSRTANPTTQGVALRGIGGSAQSRSLVLTDGVPLNDAFGGWVYWNKVPQ